MQFIKILLLLMLTMFVADRATAQFTFGPQVQTTPSASITYNSGTSAFQYTDAANSSDDTAYVPLTGTAAVFITTSNGWTVSLTANLSARSMTAASEVSPHVAMLLGLANSNDLTNYSVGYTLVSLKLDQHNNTGGGDDSDYPQGWYGTAAKFGAHTSGIADVTTPLGDSLPSSGGGVYLPLSGGTNASSATESISAATGILTISYSALNSIVTGYYNGTPVGSYSIAGWGSNPPLTLVVAGGSGENVGATAGTDTASNFSASLVPVLAVIRSSGQFILTWPTNAIGFTLQSAPAVTGTYTNIPGATNSPYTNPITGSQKFFRLSQ